MISQTYLPAGVVKDILDGVTPLVVLACSAVGVVSVGKVVVALVGVKL